MKRATADQVSTPAYVLSRSTLTSNIKAAREAFAGWTIGYSVKTNWLPQILQEVRMAGLCAEVVSEDEYRLARASGFNPSDIIYNGPVKGRETFLEALAEGARVNIDSWREIDWLNDIRMPAKVGIRINLSAEGETDPAVSRFGFSDNCEDLAAAIARIRAIPNVSLNGLHLHRNTRGRRVDNYRNAIRQAVAIIEKYKLRGEVDTLDIGGNFSAPLPGKPSFGHYARAVTDELARTGYDHLRLIAEPGNALIATAMDFVMTVIDVRTASDESVLVTADGSRNDIDPLFRANDWRRQVIPGAGSPALSCRRTAPLQVLCGCSCMEQDRILEFAGQPRLIPGDRIVIHHAGAYSLSLAPMFIRQLPAVYVLDGHDLTLCRSAWRPEMWRSGCLNC